MLTKVRHISQKEIEIRDELLSVSCPDPNPARCLKLFRKKFHRETSIDLYFLRKAKFFKDPGVFCITRDNDVWPGDANQQTQGSWIQGPLSMTKPTLPLVAYPYFW